MGTYHNGHSLLSDVRDDLMKDEEIDLASVAPPFRTTSMCQAARKALAQAWSGASSTAISR